MPNPDPRKIAGEIYDVVPIKGRYEQDIFNDFLLRYARYSIKEALSWLVDRGHLRKCGTTLRPLYVRSFSRGVRYTNIRPVHGEDVLLQMHANFPEKSE